RRVGVDAAQQTVQALRTAHVRDLVEPGAKRVIRAGPGKQAARQRAVVEAGAADQDGQLAARVDVANGGRGIARELRGRIDLGWIRDVDQMVRDATARVER